MQIHKWSEVVREMSPERRAKLAVEVHSELLAMDAPVQIIVRHKRELWEVRRSLRRLHRAIPPVEKAGSVAVHLRMAIMKVNELVK